MKTFRWLALVGVSVLAGCAVSRPPSTVPAASPAGWHAPLPHQGRLADLQRWWLQLDDPLLAELIDASQAASPTLATARTRIAEARAARTAAGAALAPTLDAQASASRGNNQPPVPLVSTAQVGLQAGWEIDLFGGRSAQAQAAQARLEGAQAGWHQARVAVAAETANAYLGLRSCQRLLGVAERDARSRAETARLSQLSADAGFAAPASAALARASAAEASARLTQQRAQCDTELKALVALSGLVETALRERLAAAWTPPPGDLFTVTAVPAEMLVQRPDVFVAEREVAAASADVGAARADRFPRLTLSGSVAAGTVRTGGSTVDAQTWAIGPLALTLPLFDAGRRAANVDAAQARYEEAATLYRARVREAVREVEQALVALDSARARGEDARTATEGYRVSFTATEARYRAGLASLVELEDARRTALAAETALVGLERERLAAWVALYRATGGGWSRADATPAR